jgi:hypothetical protein
VFGFESDDIGTDYVIHHLKSDFIWAPVFGNVSPCIPVKVNLTFRRDMTSSSRLLRKAGNELKRIDLEYGGDVSPKRLHGDASQKVEELCVNLESDQYFVLHVTNNS